ncbi:MAG: hypothetical protein N5P05_004133 (plasmid) [Chroococcopsis gigantea SAG 12.99]|jgi:hypothetical protein|nr:hypothetical protein [Chroococcopsis gigantea SAG 12.99]
MKTTAFLGILGFLGATLPVLAKPIPFQSMPLYSAYKKELLSQGWKPVPSPYSINPRPKEVYCGASGSLCTAVWRDPQTGDIIEFTIWEGRNRELRVAPAFELKSR